MEIVQDLDVKVHDKRDKCESDVSRGKNRSGSFSFVSICLLIVVKCEKESPAPVAVMDFLFFSVSSSCAVLN